MNLREVFFIVRRYAGHSKWQNIRHTKALKDSQRSMLYLQLCRRIKVAIQENGNNSNPASNLQLAQAIENARMKDMPLASIQSCIKSTQISKDGAKIIRYGVKGPKGSILLVTALTHHQKRTKDDICMILNKVGGIFDPTLEKNFEQKGLIIASPPPGITNLEEVSVDHAIEAEAEEVSLPDSENKLSFTCEVNRIHKVKKKLEELNYQVEESKFTFIPKLRVSLSEEEMQLMGKIADKIEEIPEVLDIHDNIE